MTPQVYRSVLLSTIKKRCDDGSSVIDPLPDRSHQGSSAKRDEAYNMNVVTTMRPWLTWINCAIFIAPRWIASSLDGLLGISIIHLARWIIIDLG
jgi:hypothetical protein